MTHSPQKTATQLRKRLPGIPGLAIVLGSGFNGLLNHVQMSAQIPYASLPGFPRPRVKGHSGKLVLGRLNSVPLLLMCGRSHYYEGYSMAEITFPICVLAELGIQTILLSNAAGGINPRFRPGDFMCLTDHINFMGANPLRGQRLSGKAVFLDLSEVYDPTLIRLLKTAAQRTNVRLHAGIYLAVSGPAYETPAEIQAFATLGADAVGMSTVPEAIVARQCGLKVGAISCITNRAAGMNNKPISHAEVLAMGEKIEQRMTRLLRRFVELCSSATS